MTTPSAEVVTSKRKKGKQKQSKPVPGPVPEPTVVAGKESQSQGPLGAPVLSTSDPQILEEEAEEEDPTFQVGEMTPDAVTPGQQGDGTWDNNEVGRSETSPLFSPDNEEEFRNVWGGDGL